MAADYDIFISHGTRGVGAAGVADSATGVFADFKDSVLMAASRRGEMTAKLADCNSLLCDRRRNGARQ